MFLRSALWVLLLPLVAHSAPLLPKVFELPPAPPPPKSQMEYWDSTGLKLSHFFEDVIPNCYLTERDFRGCFDVLAALVSTTKPKHTLATDRFSSLGYSQIAGETGTYHGALKIYADREVPKTLSLSVLKDRLTADTKIRAQVIAELYQKVRRDQSIPFLQLVQAETKTVLAEKLKGHESYLVAQLYNFYIARADDPHSRLSPAEMERDMMKDQSESYSGIGAMLSMDKAKVWVHSMVANSPAALGGLKRNDILVRVDGKNPKENTTSGFIELLMGKEGSPVTLTVKRGAQWLDIKLIRSKINRPNVEAFLLTDLVFQEKTLLGTQKKPLPIGYIILRSFLEEKAAEEVMGLTMRLVQSGAKALILDLRNNGGGLLTNAAYLGAFYAGPEKRLLSVKDLGSSKMTHIDLKSLFISGGFPEANATRFVNTFPRMDTLPIVILQNAGSASASEILAGTLQDHEKAWIVGDRSFGKGTVQGIANYPFKSYVQDPKNPKILFRKTIQRFYQPSGRTNQIQGIIPNFYVDSKPDATADDRIAVREEDAFEGSLPAITKEWKETRSKRVSEIEACRTELQLSLQKYKAIQQSNEGLQGPDYQLYSAQEIAACDVLTSGL